MTGKNSSVTGTYASGRRPPPMHRDARHSTDLRFTTQTGVATDVVASVGYGFPAEVGERIPLRYSPHDPTIHKLEPGHCAKGLGRWSGVIWGLGLLGQGSSIWTVRRAAVRWWFWQPEGHV